MVQTLVTLTKYENKVINLIKDAFDLKSKNEAIELIIREKGTEILEPELRPEFIKEMQRVAKEKPIHIGNLKNLNKLYKST